MLRNRRTKRATVYLVAVVFLVCSLTRTEASRLRKTERRDGRKEATETASSISEGVIVFGKGTKSLNASVEDDTAYQADSPVWPKGRVDFASKEAAWRRLSPSLLCGSDQMKFRAVGSPVKFISLDQEPPSNCGYNMQRTPFGLVMHVPYDGCNVVQEHGNYELPLRWHGIPVTLRCSKPTDPAATQNPAVLPPLDPHMFPGGILPPFYPPWLIPKPQDPAYATTTPQNPMPTAPPVPPGLMDPYYWLYYWNQQYKPQEPATTAPPQDPVVPQMPQGSLPYLYYLHQLMHHKPKDPATAAPNVPQIPPAYFGAYPWFNYVPVTPATTTAEKPKPAYLPFNPYTYYTPYYPFPAGAPATAPPATGHFSWYAHAANMPWFVPRHATAADHRTNAASYKPQYFPHSWYHATTAAVPPTNMPHHHAQVHYHSPVEVSSQLQQYNLPMHKSK